MIDVIHTGPFQVNTLVVHLEGPFCYIVDPACCEFTGDQYAVSRFLEAHSLVPLFIVLTHGHFDHVSGVRGLKEKYRIPVFIHEGDAAYVEDSSGVQEDALVGMGFEVFLPYVKVGGADCYLKGGETLLECWNRWKASCRRGDAASGEPDAAFFEPGASCGGSAATSDETSATFGSPAATAPETAASPKKLTPACETALKSWAVLHTPGHSQGSICLYNQSQRTLIAGDTVFYHSWGRTDLPGGSESTIQKSLRKIYHDLPRNTLVYPGHDYAGFCLEENL